MFFRDSSSFVRSSSHPSTPPSTPAEGTFFPDAPIQFDIMTPHEEATKSLQGSDSQQRLLAHLFKIHCSAAQT